MRTIIPLPTPAPALRLHPDRDEMAPAEVSTSAANRLTPPLFPKPKPAPRPRPTEEVGDRQATSLYVALDPADELRLSSRLCAAGRRGEGHRVHELACELLSRQLPEVRRRVFWRLRGPGWSPEDRDDAVSAASERILAALLRNPSRLSACPLTALVGKNVDWAVIELRRERSRRWEREPPTDPADLPEAAPDPPPWPLEQAVAARELLRPMSQRERTIVYEHHVRELDLDIIARRYGMSAAAVKKTLQRGKQKVREAHAREQGLDGDASETDTQDRTCGQQGIGARQVLE